MRTAAHPHSTAAAEVRAAAATSAEMCAAASAAPSWRRIGGAGENGTHGDDSEEFDF
jgi:hypothetical protein